ncbi:MAG: hypothetical protein OXI30_07390 [Chloroflexota bacterium]|nr:hypothetical protein [Chloroflexota bacterium]
MTRGERGIIKSTREESGDAQSLRQIASLEINEGVLSLLRDRQNHDMEMEKQRQKDDTETMQMLIKEVAPIMRASQLISGALAIGGLIGGVHLISIEHTVLGAALLFGDASYVAFNTLRQNAKDDKDGE